MQTSATQRIMTAARQVFLDKGFERASIDAIARVARVSKQSIYTLHPSKADLFAAVMRDAMQNPAVPQPVAASAENRSPSQLLTSHVQHYLQAALTAERRGLVRANIVAARQFPELYEELRRLRLGTFAIPVEQLAPLLEAGDHSAPDAVETSRRLASLAAEGSRYLFGYDQPTPEALQTLARTSVLMMLEGYMACLAEGVDGCDAGSQTDLEGEFPKAKALSLRLPQDRVAAILDAAAAEFLKYGFRQANLDRIIGTLGVSTATLHRHFVNKNGLFIRAVQHLAKLLWCEDCPAARPDASLEEDLAQLARWTLERHLAPESLALQRLMIREADRFPATARWVYEQMLAAPEGALQERIAAHRAPPPGPFAKRAFFTLVTYGLRFVITAEDLNEQHHADLAATGVRLFLRGCAQTPPHFT
ncbi:MAG TPA: TetR family transcriptional regulator [Pedomonas sp.]|uniref:TetR/AcrR family transcriptional regulator n=1 Tax=Pedomonas sp. TaxID=2976421 RepID=UPI002F42DBB2